MLTLEEIGARVAGAVAGAAPVIVPNPGPSGQRSLSVDPKYLVEVARFLRHGPELRFDYLSNLTAVDWLDRTIRETKRTRETIDGVERDIDRVTERVEPGFLEVVYHLYSVELKHGPLVLRARTEGRANPRLPSVTPIWRGAEFQEREAYDLFGIQFDGHPDLRRILMWDGFADYPMRKDYAAPDDFEYEPTAHDEILERARKHYPDAAKEAGQ